MNQRSVKRYAGKISAWVLCMAMIFTMTFVPTFAETEVDSTTVEESSAKEDVVMEIEGEELRGIRPINIVLVHVGVLR